MRRIAAVVLGLVIVGAADSRAGIPFSEARCPSLKLKAASKAVARKIQCHERAASLGSVVDPACLTKAAERFAGGFARGESAPPCFATGDTAAVEALIDAFVDGLVTSLRPVSTASRCVGKKLRATGRNASKQVVCHQRAVRGGDTVDQACLDTAVSAFSDGFVSADGLSDCLTTGDEAATAASVGAFLDGIVTALRPVTPSLCTSEKLDAAGEMGDRKLECHAAAALHGEVTDAACLTDADERFGVAFATAEARPNCYTAGDLVLAQSAIDTGVDALVAALRPVLTMSPCAEDKLGAVGVKFDRTFFCRSRSVRRGLPLSPACLAHAEEPITVVFPRAEQAGGCVTTGDAASASAMVDVAVSMVELVLLP